MAMEAKANAVRTVPSPDRRGEAFYEGAISLASGCVGVATEQWETERLIEGLKLVIVEGGELLCKLPDQPQSRIVGPCICAIWNRGENEAIQSFLPGCRIPYTMISLTAPAVEQHLVADFEPLRDRFGIDGYRPRLSMIAVPRSVRALCTQVATCPLKGFSRTLYLSGKALEIAAHAVAAFDASEPRDLPRLATSDIEKLHLARDILAARLRNPPSLAELSAATGLNARKLKAGFQRVFEDSVYGYLQSLRLEEAYRLLSEGDMNVSSVAYRVGYSPAHLSVAFRKRFRLSPKQLKP